MIRDEMIEKLIVFCNYKRKGCHYPDDCVLSGLCHGRTFHTMKDKELKAMCFIIKTEFESNTSTLIEIPAGATNGDVIKKLFPYVTVKDNCAKYYSVNLENLSEDDIAYNTVGLRKDWWTAPYEGSETDANRD